MRRTKASLYYLASYLLVGGLGFLFAPHVALRVFMSTGRYDDVMVRFVGLLLLALGILIVGLIRTNATALYGTTLIARSVILVGLAYFLAVTRDPMMAILLGIVGFGFILTGVCYLMDRRTQDGHAG